MKKTLTAAMLLMAFNAYALDSKKFCAQLGASAGGSSFMEMKCRDLEATAVLKIDSQKVPNQVLATCARQGDFMGGSYHAMSMCIDMELNARKRLGK